MVVCHPTSVPPPTEDSNLIDFSVGRGFEVIEMTGALVSLKLSRISRNFTRISPISLYLF